MDKTNDETQLGSGSALDYKPKAQKPSKRRVQPPNETLYRSNLECFGPDMAKILEDHQETEVPTETDIIVQGLKNPVCLVIVGFSGLAVLEAARKTKKDIQNVVIIEPSLGVFKQALKRWYIGNLVRDESIDLIVGIPPEELGPHLLKAFTTVDPGGSRAAKCIAPEIIFDPFVYLNEKGEQHPLGKQVVDVVMSTARQVVLSMGCASDSFFRWEQLIRNDKALQSSYRISPLFDQFKDMPAMVLGAGPSLQGFIDAYHDTNIKDRCLIIACDASLRRLLDHNIRPHLVTRCERKFTPIFRGVSRGDTKDIYYAAYPWCDPAFFDLFERSFMMYRGNGVCKFTDPYTHGFVDGGVSSANAALELAYLFGCKEIYLSGIDLCFLDGRSHAEGTQVEFDPESSRKKWKEIPGNNGEKVTTIPVWERCLAEYQGAIFKHSDKGARVFNTSERGAMIPGAKVISWAEASDRLKSKEIPTQNPLKAIESKLDLHAPSYAESFQKKKKDMAKYMGDVLSDLEKLFLSIHDHMLIAKREEERIVGQLQSFTDPEEFHNNVAQSWKSLATLYNKPSEEIDRFKQKYYVDTRFTESLIDICMVDYAQTEQKIMSLKNVIDRDHDRMRRYIGLHMGLFKTFEIYAKRMKDLLENGADQSVEFYDGHPVMEAMTEEERKQIDDHCGTLSEPSGRQGTVKTNGGSRGQGRGQVRKDSDVLGRRPEPGLAP